MELLRKVWSPQVNIKQSYVAKLLRIYPAHYTGIHKTTRRAVKNGLVYSE